MVLLFITIRKGDFMSVRRTTEILEESIGGLGGQYVTDTNEANPNQPRFICICYICSIKNKSENVNTTIEDNVATISDEDLECGDTVDV